MENPLSIQHQSKDELLHTLQAYQAAVDIAAIVSISDNAGKIIYVNNKFLEISHYNASELLGQTHHVVNSGYHPPEFFKNMWDTISAGKPWRAEIRNRDKFGEFYWVDTVITPVYDEKGKICQYLSVMNQITPQKESEEKMLGYQQELIQRENQLKEAQKISKTGSWHLDLVQNLLLWSEEAYRIFEIPIGTAITYETFLEKVHPQDRNMVNESWMAALKGADYEIEHRIITGVGEKWVREKAKLEADEFGNLLWGIGTVQDITEKKKTEESLVLSESLYKNLFINSPYPIGILEKDTLKFLEVNDKSTSHYGYSRKEFLELTAFDVRFPDEHNTMIQLLKAGNYASNKRVRAHIKKNGEVIYVEPSITAITYNGKEAFLISINDITENLSMQEQLLHARVRQQKEIGRATMEAQEKYREWIGRELHDNINQLLVASNMYLKNIKPAEGANAKYVGKSISIISEAINEIRKLSWSLVPPTLNDIGLKESIENLVLHMSTDHLQIEFNIDIDESGMSEGLKINIYRIVQEQVNNIIKHSQANNAIISMNQQSNLLKLAINDNGKGFEIKQKAAGIGLMNIMRRAEIYDGKVEIDSSPGNGCTVRVEFITESSALVNS